MSPVEVLEARLIGPNPASLDSQFVFEVWFELQKPLEWPLTWSLVYVGSVDDKLRDQELDSVELPTPLNPGRLKFTFTADPPNFDLIDPEEVQGVTVLLLEGMYLDQEFVRIGWYVHNTYKDIELEENPPEIPQLDKMERLVIVDEPRVTRFLIDWERNVVSSNPADETMCCDNYTSCEAESEAGMCVEMTNDGDGVVATTTVAANQNPLECGGLPPPLLGEQSNICSVVVSSSSEDCSTIVPDQGYLGISSSIEDIVMA